MVVRHVALIAVCLTLSAACWSREAYNSHLEGLVEKTVTPIPKDEDQIEKSVHSDDDSSKKRLLESLPSDGQYLIVAGESLLQDSEALDGQLLRMDATLIWISPGAEAGMSTFETRDGLFVFEVSWGDPNLVENAEKIMKIKERILTSHSKSKFRLYGRWKHEDSMFHNYRVLNIDQWKIVEW